MAHGEAMTNLPDIMLLQGHVITEPDAKKDVKSPSEGLAMIDKLIELLDIEDFDSIIKLDEES